MSDSGKLFSISWRDIPAAISLLTRIPMPFDHKKMTARSAEAVWAYPIAGAVVGAIAGGIIALLNQTTLPSGFVAGIGLVLLIMLSGAMHEDGLADCADGFWGGHDKKRRLEIMKDSRMGAYGVIALVTVLVVEWSLIEGLIYATPIALFAAMGALSRAPMALAMSFVSNARQSGLSAQVGRPPSLNSVLGGLVAIGISVLTLGGAETLVITIVTLVGAVLVFGIAINKIGGQTGDVLGASQKIAHICGLAALYTL